MNTHVRTIEIDDPADPRVDDYRDIQDRQLKGPAGMPGLFMGEQPLIVKQMLSMPGVTKSVMVMDTWADRIAPLAPPDVPVYVAPLSIMRQIAGFTIHRGVLAVGRRDRIEHANLDQVLTPIDRPVTLLICEDIANIDNIGFLFRAAAAFGVDGVLLSRKCHDPLYRKSLRVAIGHTLQVPFARAGERWRDDLDRLRSEFNITLIAAALDERSVDMDSLERPERVGIVVGPEYAGLPQATLERCDHRARIPMAQGVDSLNVGVAAAVLLHRFSTGARS